MRKKYSRTFTLNAISLFMAGIAAALVLGYVQSDTRTTWTNCKVDVLPFKSHSATKKAAKRLICNQDQVIISIRDDHPLTKQVALEHENVLSCWYDVERNKFGLFTDQIVSDSVVCHTANDTG
mgnify:CR=1 FL=1